MKNKEKIKKVLKKAMEATNEGFTYVETLVCLLVILLLTAVVSISAIKMMDRAKETKCRKEIRRH